MADFTREQLTPDVVLYEGSCESVLPTLEPLERRESLSYIPLADLLSPPPPPPPPPPVLPADPSLPAVPDPLPPNGPY